MNKTKSFLLAAAVAAMAFTFSCDSGGGGDDGGGGGGYSGSYGSVSHGGQTYKTVVIGTQTWMAENLNYAVEGSKCYDNLDTNCVKYGRLYDWSTAMTACPSGWHLPSEPEWDVLLNYSGWDSATKLKATSGWEEVIGDGNGTDDYGFSALPGGGYVDGSFHNVGFNGLWWSTTEDVNNKAYSLVMYSHVSLALILSFTDNSKSYLHSVRCVKD